MNISYFFINQFFIYYQQLAISMNPLINRIYKTKSISTSRNKNNYQSKQHKDKTQLQPKVTKKLQPLDLPYNKNKSFNRNDDLSLKKRTILPSLKQFDNNFEIQGLDKTLKQHRTLRKKYLNTSREIYPQPELQQSFFPTQNLEQNITIMKTLPVSKPIFQKPSQLQMNLNESLSKKTVDIEDQLELFEYIKAISLNPDLEQQFCYMNRGEYPYEYKIVQYDDRNRQQYITVSIRGITFYTQGESQFYTQDVLKREIKLYNKIKKIDFFKNYLAQKTLKIWMNTMLRKKFDLASKSLQIQLFSLDPFIRQYIQKIGDIQYQMSCISFLQPKISKTLEISDFQIFLKDQQHRIFKSVNFYEKKIFEGLVKIINMSLKHFRQQKRITLGEESSQRKGFLLLDAKKNQMKYTQQATIKEYQYKMWRLAKYTDLIRVNSTIKTIKNGLKNIQNCLFTIFKKFYKQHSGTHICWIRITVNISEKGLQCYPNFQVISNIFKLFVHNIIKYISRNHKPFIKNPDFSTFDHPQYDPDEQRSFKYYLQQDLDYKHLKEDIQYQVKKAYTKVELFLESCQTIVNIYKKSLLSQNLQFYLQNKNLREYLDNYQTQRQLLKQIKNQHEEGIFFIDFQKVRIQIQKMFNEKYRVITTSLPQQVIRRSDLLGLKVKKMYNQFKENPKSIKTYIQFTKNFKSKKSDIETISDMIDQLRQLEDMLTKNKIKVGEKAKAQINEAYSLYIALRKRIQQIERDQQKERTYFQKQLQHMFPQLQQKSQRLLQKLYQDGLVTSQNSQSDKVLIFLEQLQIKFNKILQQKNNFYAYQKQMGSGYTQIQSFIKLEKQFKCFLRLWEFKKKFDSIIQILSKKSYKQIDFNINYSVLNQFLNLINVAFSQIESIQILQYFKNLVENSIDLLTTCKFFCDQDLVERHFQEIKAILKNQKYPARILFTKEGFTLSPNDLQQRYFIRQKRKQIQLVSIKASNQAQIIKSISIIEGFWKGTKLQFSNFQDNKQVFVLNQNQEVSDKVDDNIIQLHIIASSKYVDCVKIRLNQQKIIYSYFRNLLDIWHQTQKLWQKLLPILMSPSSLKQQNSTYYQFIAVDNNIKRFNKMMHDLVFIKKISEDSYTQQYLNILKYNKNQLQKLKKTLQQYIQQKRNAYNRFYFLTDSELTKVLQETRDPASLQKFLPLCFDIQQLIYQKQLILGVKYKQQTFKIRSIFFRGQIQQIFKNIEDMLKISLRSSIKASIPKYKNDPNLLFPWFNQIPMQTLLVIDRIMWTQFAERFISQGNHKDFIQMNAATIHTLSNKVVNSNGINRLLFTCLLLQNLYLNQISTSLCHTQTTHKDFKWIMQPRFYFIQQQVHMKILNSNLIYGYQYCAPYLYPVYTSITEKVVYQTFNCLSHHNGLILQGHEGVGKSQLVKQMSRLSGNYLKNFTCSVDMPIAAIIKFLKGICLTGIWATFDNFTSLSYQSMSVMFQKFSEILIMRVNDTPIDFQGKFINIHKHTMFFMIRIIPDKHILLEKSKESFNQMYIMLPDEKKICQWILQANGFKDWQSLSSKLYGMFNSCREVFNKYDFSLSALKRTLNKALLIQKRDPSKLEEGIIYEAIKKQNYTNIIDEDQIIFLNLLKRYFTYEEQIITNILLALMTQHPLLQIKGIKQKYFQLDQALQTSKSAIIVGERSSKTTLMQIYKDLKNMKITKIYPLAHQHIWNQATVQYIKQLPQNSILIFDGELKKQWIDLLNASMNYSRSIVIINGEKLIFNTTLVFEARSLAECPPSFIANMKIIYIDSRVEGKYQIQNLLNKSNILPNHKKLIFQTCQNHIQKLNINDIQLFCNWIVSLYSQTIRQKALIKLVTWILAHVLKQENNLFWNKFYPGKFQQLYFSTINEDFIQITSAIQQLIYKQTLGFHQLIICTKQVAFYKNIIINMHKKQKNILIKGNPGTFKSSIMKYSTKNIHKIIISSTFTTPQSLQNQMEQKLNIIRKGNSSSWSYRQPYIIEVDDIHLAGTNISEIMRQIADMKYMRLKSTILQRQLESRSIVATSNKNISNKIESRFNVFNIDSISNQNIKTICQQMVFSFLRYYNFKRQVVEITNACISAICILFQDLQNIHNSYIHNMHIVTKTLKYLISLKKNIFIEADDFVSLFTYNFKRYTFSKISSQSLYNQTRSAYQNSLKVAFKGVTAQKKYWISKNRKFQKVKLSDIIDQQMKNFTDKILFQEAIKYAIKINNQFHMENGHVIFVGMAGSGKKFLTYLSCVLSQRIFIDISNEIIEKKAQFRICMFDIIKRVMFQNEKIVVYQSNLRLYLQNSKIYDELILTDRLPYQFWSNQQKKFIQKQIEIRKPQNPNIKHQIFQKLSTYFSIVFAFQKNKELSHILNKSKLLTCYYCEIKQWSRQAMVIVGQKITKNNIQIITNLHYRLSKLIGQQIRHNPSLVIYQKFIRSCQQFYGTKQKSYYNRFDMYTKVYKKIKQSCEIIKQWQVKADALKIQIKNQILEIEKIIFKQQEQQKTIREKKSANQEQQKSLLQQNIILDKKQKILDKQISKLNSILKSLQNSLNNIQRTQFGQIKKLYVSNPILKFCLQSIDILLQNDGQQIYKLLADPNLLMKMKSVNLQKTDPNIKSKLRNKILNNKLFNQQQIQKLSGSSKTICRWIYEVTQFWNSHENSQNKSKQLKYLNDLKIRSQLRIDQLREQIQEGQKRLILLDKQYLQFGRKKQDSQNELDKIKQRLRKSQEIIPYLLKEQIECKKQIQRLKIILQKLNGNCILTGFMINYCCSLEYESRKQILQKAKMILNQFNIKYDEKFYEIFMSRQQRFMDCRIVENSICLYNCKGIGMIIDPERKAVEIIVKEYRNIIQKSYKDEDINEFLNEKVKQQCTIIISDLQNIDFYNLNSVMRREDRNANCRIFLYTTNLYNKIKESIISKTIPINWKSSTSQFYPKFIKQLINKNLPHLNLQKNSINQTLILHQIQIQSLKSSLFSQLITTHLNILDSQFIITKLTQSNQIQNSISLQYQHLLKKLQQIHQLQLKYHQTAAILQKITQTIHQMVHISIDVILPTLSKDQDNIIRVTRWILRILTQNQKNYFLFVSTLKIRKQYNNIKLINALFQQTGTSINPKIKKPTVCASLNEGSWRQLYKIVQYNNKFEHIIENIIKNPKQWQTWFGNNKLQLPGSLNYDYTMVQTLLIIKVLKTQKLFKAIQKYIQQTFNYDFFTGQNQMNDQEFITISNPKNPIIYQHGLNQFIALTKKLNKKFQIISLSSKFQELQKLVNDCIGQGKWIGLIDCEVLNEENSISIENMFKKILEKEQINEDYRLFMIGDIEESSLYLKNITICLSLQNMSIKNTMKQLVLSQDFTESNKDYTKLKWLLSIIHSIIIGKNKYPNSFQHSIQISKNNFKRCITIINYIQQKNIQINYQSISQFFSEIYHQQIHTHNDKYHIQTIFNTYMDDNIANSTIFVYPIPQSNYIQAIQQFPYVDSYEIFGFNSNISIAIDSIEIQGLGYQRKSLKYITQKQLNEMDRVDKIRMSELINKLPNQININKIENWIDYSRNNQSHRYNYILNKARQILNQCLLIEFKDQIQITQSMRQLNFCIANNILPIQFQSFYNSKKTLTKWIQDLSEKIYFFNQWMLYPQKSFKPHHFLNFSVFLETFKLNQSQKKHQSTQLHHLQFKFLKVDTKDSNTQSIHLIDLVFDQCKYNIEKKCLQDSIPGSRFVRAPILQVSSNNIINQSNNNTCSISLYAGKQRERLIGRIDVNSEKSINCIMKGGCLISN